MATAWNPWRGCHRRSEGCKYCYIHKGDARRKVDTDSVVKTDKFDWPVRRNKKGEYRVKPGGLVYLCFDSDFLVEDADGWRKECWDMIRQRDDLHFLFLTKRIERFRACAPPDWAGGWDNVTVGCTVENQQRADERLSLFADLPIKHKNIICQPLIEQIDVGRYLHGVERVVVGGESDRNARPLHYDWVLDIRRQCIAAGVRFEFRQCGTHFLKDGKNYTLRVKDLAAQARKAGIDC
ncbi:phage Gp37/Gp68 family protein [Ruminococcaceae bacterium OttesenSCG-928-I18]|nr:phage Gp37/Gp68 family protein [Ruminococcaceae bacterium OttesenSCG-928-I18]